MPGYSLVSILGRESGEERERESLPWWSEPNSLLAPRQSGALKRAVPFTIALAKERKKQKPRGTGQGRPLALNPAERRREGGPRLGTAAPGFAQGAAVHHASLLLLPSH